MSTDEVRKRIRASSATSPTPRPRRTIAVLVEDAEALCDLADHARAFTNATSEGDIKLAQELELKMLDDLARLDGEPSHGGRVVTAPPETSTPVGRLRTAVLCAHDPKGLGEDAQDWLHGVLRDDLPKLLELYRTCCAGDERDVFDTLTRLDGRECVCPSDDTLALCPEHGDGAEVER